MLTVAKFMPELHLRQPKITCSACGPFTKLRERIQKIKETGDLNYIYKSDLDKASFAHDTAYSDSKDLSKRIVPDEILKGRVYEVAINPKYDEYERGVANMEYNSFHKKTGSEVSQELHKPVIKKIQEKKGICQV